MDFQILFISILTNVVVTVPISTFLVYLFRGFITNQFAKIIEKYKNTLNELSKEKEYELKRYFEDYSHYSKQKQEILPELYTKFSKASGLLISIADFHIVNDYSKFTKDQLKFLIPDIDISEIDKNEILESFQSLNKEDVIEKIIESENKEKLATANKFFYDFKNYVILNEIYFSTNINSQLDGIIKNLARLLIFAKAVLIRNNDFSTYDFKEEESKKYLINIRPTFSHNLRKELMGRDT